MVTQNFTAFDQRRRTKQVVLLPHEGSAKYRTLLYISMWPTITEYASFHCFRDNPASAGLLSSSADNLCGNQGQQNYLGSSTEDYILSQSGHITDKHPQKKTHIHQP